MHFTTRSSVIVSSGGVVAQAVGHRTYDGEVAGSTAGRAALRNNLRQVDPKRVPL